MTSFLLDVNVLVALLDPNHVHNERAVRWFYHDPALQWLTCPITENGAARIMSGAGYSHRLTVWDIALSLRALSRLGRHSFLADDLTIRDDTVFAYPSAVSTKQLTDVYLLALAAIHDATFVSLDRRISTSGIRVGGARILNILSRPRCPRPRNLHREAGELTTSQTVSMLD